MSMNDFLKDFKDLEKDALVTQSFSKSIVTKLRNGRVAYNSQQPMTPKEFESPG